MGREDFQTNDLAGAAAFERNHHAHDVYRGEDISPDDVPTGRVDGREHCPGCTDPGCLDCAMAAILRHGWDT